MTFETQSINQAGQDQLDIVAGEFEDWRRQKKYRREKIPGKLLREAQKLTQHLGATAVRRRLGLTKGQINKLDAEQPFGLTQAPEFMQLISASGKTTSQSSGLSIDICTPKGIKISLSGLPQKDPLALMAKLLEGGEAC